MGNQLLFWYRRRTVHAEAGDTNHPCLPAALFLGCVGVVSVGPDLVVGKRVNRGDAQW